MKRKLWIYIAAAIAAFVLSLCFFSVRVRIFPRLVLSGALNKSLTQLETRYEKSPLHMFGDVFDPLGCYQTDLQLETDMDYVGLVRYDMDLQMQLAPLRVAASGTVVTGGKALDLSLYLDRDFAAVSSDGLVGGNYYGITYDRFSQDIRSRELLAVLIGEDTISQWENGVSALANAMSSELKQPEFSSDDIRTALYAVLTLNPQISKQKLTVSGEERTVYSVSFQATGQQIGEAAKPHQNELTPQLSAWIDSIKNDSDFLAQVVFFLDRGALIKLEINLQYSGGSSVIRVLLGNAEELKPVELELQITEGEDLNRFSLSVDTASNEESYQEYFILTQTRNGVRKSHVMDYNYDLSSGELNLHVATDGKQAEMKMHLAEEGERLTIITQDAAPLLDLFREKPLKTPVICTMSVMPGGVVTTPEYRNLDQWSMEDLWTLLKGFGSLVGLKLP